MFLFYIPAKTLSNEIKTQKLTEMPPYIIEKLIQSPSTFMKDIENISKREEKVKYLVYKINI